MQKLIIELTGDDSLEALQELESKKLIRIIKEPDFMSFALPGEAFNENDFKK